MVYPVRRERKSNLLQEDTFDDVDLSERELDFSGEEARKKALKLVK